MAEDIVFGPQADRATVSAHSMQVLRSIMASARLSRIVVTSTARTPEDQARAMYDNLQAYGAAHQRALYGPAGDQVIDVYERARQAGRPRQEIEAAMARRIRELGPTNVSRHAVDPRLLNVIDVDPASVADRAAFERAVAAERRVAKFLQPPKDPSYHLEIPQP